LLRVEHGILNPKAVHGDLVVKPAFRHEAFLYAGRDEFLDGTAAFIRDGLSGGEPTLVVLSAEKIGLLRAELGTDADQVQFADMAEVGRNPARIIPAWSDFVEERSDDSRPLRGIGEPIGPDRGPAELVECQRHEMLLNLAFDDGPGWRLLCPYDRAHLPRAVTQGALHTHPVIATSDSRLPNSAYVPAGHIGAFAEPLREPGDAVLRGSYGPGDVPAIRRTVAQWARSCGLPDERVRVLELAASELAADSIRRSGTGTLALWLEDGAALVQFSDAGNLGDPLTGRLPARGDDGGAHYLLNQLCDLVQVRSSDRGTTVRITTLLPVRRAGLPGAPRSR
jgi:anti-sigma regulatory factor (Ser/Thr protein kinase)